ncbi:MAG: lipid A biosynthesis lauroyl acyltransferase [Ahrensia sp.]|nr:lipid A biosynthesis lauroyl acyltransferase [Ahrensia sp.]
MAASSWQRKIMRNRHVERIALRLNTAKDWTLAQIITGLLAAAKKLPPEKSTDIAEKLGRRFAPILPRTKLAKKNLALAFPKKSEAEIDQLVREVWGHVARTMAEYVFLDQLFDFDPERPGEGRIDVIGIDNFVKLRDGGRPAVIFTAHTGNWEILPVAASTYDLEVTALFRPPNNRFLAERVLKARRTEKGHLVPARAGVAWALSGVLEQGGAVGLLADQALTRGDRIAFFGREATANPLAAKLARQFDCDIYPARCVRLPGGRFRLELHDAIDTPRTGDGSIDVKATTEMINEIMEGWVREYPAQWLWLHDRWKLKPLPKRRIKKPKTAQ